MAIGRIAALKSRGFGNGILRSIASRNTKSRVNKVHNRCMPNIASVLKSEISRIARKELRSEIAGLKKSGNAHRLEIAALKRRAHALEQQLRRLGKSAAKVAPVPDAEASPGVRRFSAKGFATQRKKLGLSARECGLLVGASSQSVYNWEEGKARPQSKHLSAIAIFRSMGKRQARARLESLSAAG
jgi:DNA-binding transcriptional regulator YiaG